MAVKLPDNYQLRPLNESEIPALGRFLYEAVFIPENAQKPEMGIIDLPELSRYIHDFGRENDHALVVEADGKLAGAIWSRLFTAEEPGFGYVNDKTPEISMSVLPEYQGQGIGTLLLDRMLKLLAQNGFRQVSLSVDKRNFAYGLYRKFGFSDLISDENSAKMLKEF